MSDDASERIPLADHDEIGRKVKAQPWVIQSAVVTIAAHCTVIKDKCEDGDIAAVSDLAGCISQDLLALANFLSGTAPQAAAYCPDCGRPIDGPTHAAYCSSLPKPPGSNGKPQP